MYYGIYLLMVFLGYMILLDLEVSNLIYLIEGIRYSVLESEIRIMMVF